MSIYIIAGEPSGDVVGASLIKGLKNQGYKGTVHGIGGHLMQEQGLNSLFNMKELSIMGLVEIIPHIRRIKRRIRETAADIVKHKTKVLVTIDSSGFTHRVIKAAKKLDPNLISVHYVAPPVWAWRPWRAKKLGNFIDHLLTLFPFEPPYFTKYGLKTTFVGHPVTELKREGIQLNNASEKPLLLLLPGSRKNELKNHIPLFQQVRAYYGDRLDYAVPTLPHLTDQIKAAFPDANIVTDFDEKRDLYKQASAALAVSGTIGLELAYFRVPTLITYKANALTAYLVKKLIQVPYVCLVNILLNKSVITECLQENATPENLIKNLDELFKQDKKEIIQHYEPAIDLIQCPIKDLKPGGYAAQLVLKHL